MKKTEACVDRMNKYLDRKSKKKKKKEKGRKREREREREKIYRFR